MKRPVILGAKREWYCAAGCGRTKVTEKAGEVPMHRCPKMRRLIAPLTEVGTRAKLELHEREDYVGNEVVRLDPERRRPVMSITTTRDDGIDAVVFVPTATAKGDAY